MINKITERSGALFKFRNMNEFKKRKISSTNYFT